MADSSSRGACVLNPAHGSPSFFSPKCLIQMETCALKLANEVLPWTAGGRCAAKLVSRQLLATIWHLPPENEPIQMTEKKKDRFLRTS